MNCSFSFTFTTFLNFFFFCCCCISSAPSTQGQQQPLLSAVHKDSATRLYSISLHLQTPLQRREFFLDLGETLSWVDCANYTSSTFRNVLNNASLCTQLDTRVAGNCTDPTPSPPACIFGACQYFDENSVTREVDSGNILLDSLALPMTDGKRPGKLALDPNFVFACSKTKLLAGLPAGVTGSIALGRSNFSLPAQLSRAFPSPWVFAICLPSSSSAAGVAFFNSHGPYSFSPGVDAAQSLTYTPLVLNPFGGTVISYNRPSDEYFIGVTGIKVNGKSVPVNATLLKIITQSDEGTGGTKISTSTPYAILQTSIFRAVTAAFKEAAAGLNLPTTTKVKPFGLCYKANKIPSTQLGPAVPTIELVLQNENVTWSIFGANSMVKVRSNTLCLGFVDGGVNPRTSIVIGGLQIEDNLLQFDLGSEKLGFSSSLLSRNITCSNFDFTTAN